MSSQLEKVQELIRLREEARIGGGEKAIQKQHEKGTGSPGSSSSLLLNPAECLSHLALVSSKKQVDLTLF